MFFFNFFVASDQFAPVPDEVPGSFEAFRRLLALHRAPHGNLLGHEGHRQGRHGHADGNVAPELSG